MVNSSASSSPADLHTRTAPNGHERCTCRHRVGRQKMHRARCGPPPRRAAALRPPHQGGCGPIPRRSPRCAAPTKQHGIRNAAQPLPPDNFGGQGGAGDWRWQRHRAGDHEAARWGGAGSVQASWAAARERGLSARRPPCPQGLPLAAGLHGAKVVISGRREQVGAGAQGCHRRRRRCTAVVQSAPLFSSASAGAPRCLRGSGCRGRDGTLCAGDAGLRGALGLLACSAAGMGVSRRSRCCQRRCRRRCHNAPRAMCGALRTASAWWPRRWPSLGGSTF